MKAKHNPLRGFKRYSKDQLARLRQELGLRMSEEVLARCADHYRTAERRDPVPHELRLIDTLATTSLSAPELLTVEQFLTNDGFVAETYSDLLRKRSTLNPEARTPVSLTEALTVASRYLDRSGKPMTLPKRTLLLDDCSEARCIPGEANGFAISGARHQLRVTRRSGQGEVIEPTDTVILFQPKRDVPMPTYQKQIGVLFKALGRVAPWKHFGKIREGGVLSHLLLSIPCGFYLFMNDLIPTVLDEFLFGDAAEDEYENDLIETLTKDYIGCHIAIVSSEFAAKYYNRAPEYGIQATFIGAPNRQNTVAVMKDDEALFAPSVDFLRSLLPVKPVTAELTDEEHGTPCTASHIPTSAQSCAYLQAVTPRTPADGIQIGETLCAAAFARPTDSFFKNAIYTALCPIFTLAAAGLAYTEQRLAIGMTISDKTDARAVGNALSAVLGLYRLQAELGIPAATASLLTDSETDTPELAVFCAADGQAQNGVLAEVGHPIYLLEPTYDENGLPDFKSLRELLHIVTDLARRDLIASTRVLCGESATDGLLKMSHDGRFCRLENEAIAAGGKLPIALLLECKTEIEDLAPIGRVEQKEGIPAAEQAVLPLCEPIQSMIWSDKTEFVILCEENDIDAQILEDAILQMGGNVRFFEAEQELGGAISRALLGAHVLILCGSVHLPDNEHTRFALDTMLGAGGKCWIVGRTEFSPLEDRATLMKKGIPEDTLKAVIERK